MRIPIMIILLLLVLTSLFPVFSQMSREADTDDFLTAKGETETGYSPEVYSFDNYFLDYHGYENVTETLFNLEKNYSEIMKIYDLTALTELGETYYGRTVWGVKISDGVSEEEDWYNDPEEEDVLFVGCHHAREWMSVEVTLYYIFYLLNFYGHENIDNDNDGMLNEDPLDGYDNDGDGEDDDDNPETTARMDGYDNDDDGYIDEGIDEDCIEGLATHLVNNREIWIIPILNPDGYEYDRTISEPGSGGGWRKNQRDQSIAGGKRSPGNGEFDPDTDGVDLNRNYPYCWNKNEKGEIIEDEGVALTSDSRYEGNDMYRGPDDDRDNDGDSIFGIDYVPANPADADPDGVDEDWWDNQDNDGDGLVDEDKDGGTTEPETQAMSELMKKLDRYDLNDTVDYPEGYRPENHDRESNVIIGISYHSYSALVIWPWGFTYDDPPHEPLLDNIGRDLMDITDYGSWKDQGGYKVSGEWGDWMYGAHGTLAYTIELNTGSQGGFHPFTDLIIPTSRMNLGANLYVTKIADKTRIARDGNHANTELGFPEFIHEQKEKKVSAEDKYKLTLMVENSSQLEKGSLRVFYRKPWEKQWKSVIMTDKGEGKYSGKIPASEEEGKILYYFQGKDRRGIKIFSRYGRGTPYSYEVEDNGFLEIGFTELITFFGIAAILFQSARKYNPNEPEDSHPNLE